MATLPWLRLLIAEAILLVLTAAATLFLVIPGLVVGTLCALVGPLINLLDCSVPEAFRRSIRVVWPHFWLVFVMITQSRWRWSTRWSSSSRTWCRTNGSSSCS